MANETVIIGDYEYTLSSGRTASAKVTDTTKSSYGELQASVTHSGVTYVLKSLDSCFYGCTSLTTAPTIPSGVTDIDLCFRGCTSLTTAPSIPSGVTDMMGCFQRCTSLTTAPSIPSGVTNMGFCFYGCTSLTTAPSIPSSVTGIASCFEGCTALTGTIAVHGTPMYYNQCFYRTIQPIALYVPTSSEVPTWQQIAATGNNGNVTVLDPSTNPAPTATLNVTRVGSNGSTVPNESGEWAYVQVETTISTDQAPDNVARTPIITKDGSSVAPSTHASGTASYVDWVSLGDDKTHRIGATPRDLYKSGGEVIVTLAGTYSPMEFYTKPILNEHDEVIGYEGGVGASFGKHATREGVLDVAWDIESEGDISADGALSCADGSPYCSDGTNVNVGGITVGSADNLSYVASEDTLRAPTTHAATLNTSKATDGWVYYELCGHNVSISVSINCVSIIRGDVLATGLPIPLSTSGIKPISLTAAGNKVMPAYVNATGQLIAAETSSNAWYSGSTLYFAS